MSHCKRVAIVHAIDTEGPLYESLEATFERLEDLFGITDIEVSRENLQRLKQQELPCNGEEAHIASVLNDHHLNYKTDWSAIDEMLERLASKEFRRRQIVDSAGNGWVFNWHCVDHVGYDVNPRRRAIGYHLIFDHYRQYIQRHPELSDAIHWHFHPMSTYREAHRCARSFLNSPHLYPSLCRGVIERGYFPTVFRAGFHVERPDIHLFLEQWIPFDISNMSFEDTSILEKTRDLRAGRLFDWRRSPRDWSIYHPHHDNYQLPGNCRRWIARALPVITRMTSVDQQEMDKAFARADSGQPALVGLTSHDFRDLEPEVDYARGLIVEASKRYPEVEFFFCEAIDGFRKVLWPAGDMNPSLSFTLEFVDAKEGDVPYIIVTTDRGEVFGPQPFLAIETRGGRFFHDNFDFSLSGKEWSYAFHANTLPLEDVRRIGVAANDCYGNQCVRLLEL